MKSRIKSLASDTLIYGVSTIVGRFLTFLLTPIYSNYLTGTEYGDVIYIFSIVAFINIVYSVGMDSAFFRFYKKDDLDETKKVFTISYMSIALVSGFISLIIIIMAGKIAPVFTNLPEGPELIRIAALIPFLDAIMFIPYAYLRMTRKSIRFAYTKLILIIIAVAGNAIFVVIMKLGARGVFYSQLAANILGALIFIPLIVRHLIIKTDWSLMKQMLRYGLPTMPATLSMMVLQIADRPILKLLTNSESVAMYTVNYRLGIPMMLFAGVFEYAWKPFYLSRYEDKDAKQLYSRVLTYFTLACAIVFILTGFFIGFIIGMPFVGGKFINPVYWSGIGIIPIILGAYYFNGVYNNFAAGFHIEKKTEYLPIAIGIAAISNIALNFILIPIFNYWGAAFATLGAYIISSVVLFLFLKKVYPIKYEFRRIIIIIVTTILIYVITSWVTQYFSLWISFGIRIIALIVFVIMLRLFGFFTNDEIKKLKSLFIREKKYSS
ncbi:MAG: oligosaccharide flippase family protein [Ignavibacteriae bacterium]|nr:oligosaccharide flippase family protein [Ignavibacteriota bacterium]